MDFETIVNFPSSQKSGIILFLTDIDRFREKIKTGHNPIHRYFPEYHGREMDAIAAQEFLATKFRSAVRQPQRHLYIHYVNVTDVDIAMKMNNSIQDSIVEWNLSSLIM